MAPKDVNVKNEGEVWQPLYGQVTKTRRRGRLKADDKVRLSERVKTFKKGFLSQWTEEMFRIQRVIQGPVLMYKVEEFDGTSKARFTRRIGRKSRWTTTCYGASRKYLNDAAGKC